MKHRLSIVLSLALLTGAAAPALADPTADEVLKKADQVYSNFKDLQIDNKLLVFEAGGQAREFAFTTMLKGKEKRLVRFTAPGDIKGMGFLVENRDLMYAYLPGFAKVRRMGTHVKNAGFMGSDFNYEDMSQSTYVGVFAPKMIGQDAGSWILELTLLPGKEGDWKKEKVWFDKKLFVIDRIEYFDDKDANVRTEVREGYKADEGSQDHFTPASITVTDHRRNDHRSQIQNVRVKANQGIGDDVFSQRSLLR